MRIRFTISFCNISIFILTCRYVVNQPTTNAIMGYKLLKGIDSVGFFLKRKVVVGEAIPDVLLTVSDTEKKSGTCLIKFKVEYGLTGALQMSVTPPTITLPENDANVPKKLATITVNDIKRVRPMDISMVLNGVATNPGLELVKTGDNTVSARCLVILIFNFRFISIYVFGIITG